MINFKLFRFFCFFRFISIFLLIFGLLSVVKLVNAADNEARRAILELRQRFDEFTKENEQLKINILNLQNQINFLKDENRQLLGRLEDLEQISNNSQRKINERLSNLEPRVIQLDGLNFKAKTQEIKDFEIALNYFQNGDFLNAQQTFLKFLNNYPNSGYKFSVYFWLANTYYANKKYQEAIDNFKKINSFEFNKNSDSLFIMANCYIELKNNKEAKNIFNKLIKDYPDSENTKIAQDILKTLK